MADSLIEWTDKVWNPVRGCVNVSAGCKNCYAETFAERWRGVPGHAYEQGFDLRVVPEKLDEPLRWKKPARIFVNSMSDLFQDGVPLQFIDQVFRTMWLAPHHTFQILTKRPQAMLDYMKSRYSFPLIMPTMKAPANVWLGVSVEDQASAELRIPLLLKTPAAKHWISAEPLLERIDLHKCARVRVPFMRETPTGDRFHAGEWRSVNGLDWVVVGGESGPRARPFDVQWARTLLDQCRADGVPIFVKQLGANPFQDGTSREAFIPPMRDKKGGDMSEWPDDLRVRQFPDDVVDAEVNL